MSNYEEDALLDRLDLDARIAALPDEDAARIRLLLDGSPLPMSYHERQCWLTRVLTLLEIPVSPTVRVLPRILTDEEREDVRRLFQTTPVSRRELARRYGVSRSTVQSITRGCQKLNA